MWKEVREGSTRLVVPERGKFGLRESGMPRRPPVFYNPRMRLNRDITCAVVRALQKGGEVRFADLLAGSGAKGLRVAKEAGCEVVLNDANPAARELIKRNAALNGLEVGVTGEEANLFLHARYKAFNFIDLDPFGSPVPFLDAAAVNIDDGGVLGVTATDTAPLCGVYPKVCFRKYGSKPLRCEFVHGVGLRILLGYVARTCARHSKGVECLLSHSTEHYFRGYLRVREGRQRANKALENIGYLHYCRRCLERVCERSMLPEYHQCCGRAMEMAGPLWLGGLREGAFAATAAEEAGYLEDGKAKALLEGIKGEVEAPFYHDTHQLARVMGLDAVPVEGLVQGLREAGYRASRTHFLQPGVKTDAPLGEIKLVIKALRGKA